MADSAFRNNSSRLHRHPRTLTTAILVAALALVVTAPAARADETGREPGFDEQLVEFHNQKVKLAGSLMLPKCEKPVPAVVFVHGAGPQNREPYREVGVYFASRGIAALIYDKRGTGQSGGLYESSAPYENLIKDALSAITFLKERPEISASQIGIWGLSQGAYISAAAASRSDDIHFVIVVGAEVADGMMFYYRDNLFRRYGLSATLRDMAEKMSLVDQDLQQTFQEGFRLSSFVPRSYAAPDQFVDPAWSHVTQPVLAMWGKLDQNVPVGESAAGLKNSLAQVNNENWTILILPQTNHSLKVSESGALYSESFGYPPGALLTMADWAKSVLNRPAEIGKMKQEGTPPDAAILPQLTRYENLRWYGNGTAQGALWILFFIGFGANTIAVAWSCLARLFRRGTGVAVPASNRIVSLKRTIGTLNLFILAALSITAVLVVDQLHPNCPTILLFTPLLGTVSTLATIVLLIAHVRTRREQGGTTARRIRCWLDLLCFVLFVPYMYYWNLIGVRF